MKRLIAFVCVITVLLVNIGTAFADTSYEYCPKCLKNTDWKGICSKIAKNNSGYSTHQVDGTVCNSYYTYFYKGIQCTECNNKKTLTGTHIEWSMHDYCGNSNWCPY